jgi:hypothetical protein
MMGGAACIDLLRSKARTKTKSPSPDKEPEIDLEELRELADKSPAKRYINCSVIDMSRQPGSTLKLTESEPIPPRPDFQTHEIPSFAELLNWAKKMVRLDPSLSEIPRHEVYPVTLGRGTDRPQEFDVHVEICDGTEDDAYINLRVEPHKDERPDENAETSSPSQC